MRKRQEGTRSDYAPRHFGRSADEREEGNRYACASGERRQRPRASATQSAAVKRLLSLGSGPELSASSAGGDYFTCPLYSVQEELQPLINSRENVKQDRDISQH